MHGDWYVCRLHSYQARQTMNLINKNKECTSMKARCPVMIEMPCYRTKYVESYVNKIYIEFSEFVCYFCVLLRPNIEILVLLFFFHGSCCCVY